MMCQNTAKQRFANSSFSSSKFIPEESAFARNGCATTELKLKINKVSFKPTKDKEPFKGFKNYLNFLNGSSFFIGDYLSRTYNEDSCAEASYPGIIHVSEENNWRAHSNSIVPWHFNQLVCEITRLKRQEARGKPRILQKSSEFANPCFQNKY